MLVELEINENRLYSTKEDLSQYMKEDFLWTFVCSAGQQRGHSPISMQNSPGPCETPADLDFLSEANKQYVELGVNETLDPLRRNTTHESCNNQNRKYIYMDDSNTKANRPSDDVEAVFDEVTGETKVKLWSHEYPIDTKCQLSEMGFQDEKTGAMSGDTTYDTEENMLTGDDRHDEIMPQYDNCTIGGRFLTSNELADNLHSSLVPKFRIKTEQEANSTTLDSLFDGGMQRTSSDPCMKKKPCTSMKRTSFSYPVIADQDSGGVSRMLSSELHTESYPHLTRQRTEMEWTNCEQIQYVHQYPDQNFNSHAREQWLRYMSISTNENQSLREERKVFGITPFAGSLPTKSSLLSNRHNKVWKQTEGTLHSVHSNKSQTEDVSSSNDQKSQYIDFNQLSQDVTPYAEKTDIRERSSHTYLYHSKHNNTETREYKHKKKLKRGCRLWEYIRNLLLDPCTNPSLIKWEDRNEGTFKLVENKRIAYNWGMKKGNTDMSYEKLSRAMRYYYKKKIFQPVLGKRLVYKFGPCATGWKDDT
ncbi:uncharacterized protein LOC123536551 isoform X2 [Mercenaria mercenaria]|uniref:uncharacterized protein LOC123536551 isoform X2 n=1 Tax=Mercenaria mercenaria TaxID=6596 RepID=UPI00234EF7AF|nr:uncharacterized protein LOC123536551 isoform X2 [Mercenaria mercenaria]